MEGEQLLILARRAAKAALRSGLSTYTMDDLTQDILLCYYENISKYTDIINKSARIHDPDAFMFISFLRSAQEMIKSHHKMVNFEQRGAFDSLHWEPISREDLKLALTLLNMDDIVIAFNIRTTVSIVRSAYYKLTPKRRNLLYKRFVLNMEAKAIAEESGATLAGVKTAISKALSALEEMCDVPYIKLNKTSR